MAGYREGAWTNRQGRIYVGKRAFATDTKPTRTDATLRAYVKGGFLLLARAQDKMTGPGGDVIDAFLASVRGS